MQDIFSVPSCFSSPAEKPPADNPAGAASRSGQSLVALAYRVEISGSRRLVTVTWCKNLLAHGLSVSIQGSNTESSDSEDDDEDKDGDRRPEMMRCKVEMRPWHFWRRYGLRRFLADNSAVIDVFWDLKSAKFSSSDDPEPTSGYYVAVVHAGEVVLLLGDLKKDAFRRSGARPALLDPVLVSKKEHVFGKKRFSTRAKFHQKVHEITVECSNSCGGSRNDIDMAIKVDGVVSVLVKHLQWKFRGNGIVFVDDRRVQVYWDVHDWLFGPGAPRHALFIFKAEKPVMIECGGGEGDDDHTFMFGDGGLGGEEEEGVYEFCLFLYAWRVE